MRDRRDDGQDRTHPLHQALGHIQASSFAVEAACLAHFLKNWSQPVREFCNIIAFLQCGLCEGNVSRGEFVLGRVERCNELEGFWRQLTRCSLVLIYFNQQIS